MLRKCMFLVIVLAVILSLSACQEAPIPDTITPEAVPPTGEHEPTLFEAGALVKVTNTGNSGLRIHKDDPTGETIKVVPDGWTFRIMGSPQHNVQGHNWWEIEETDYESSPVTGWVAEEYLKEVSPMTDLVPSLAPEEYFVSLQDKVERAIQWARNAARKNENWKNLCLGFVAEAFEAEEIGWGCPQEGINNCPMGGVEKLTSENKFYSSEVCYNPPRGVLVFFSGQGSDTVEGIDYAKCGHIGIYLGDRKVVHAYGTVKIQNLAGNGGVEQLPYIDSYIGWAYPPEEWISVSTSSAIADPEGDVAYDFIDITGVQITLAGEEVTAEIELAELLGQLPLSQALPDYIEGSWTIYIDIDNDSTTGDDEGFDYALTLRYPAIYAVEKGSLKNPYTEGKVSVDISPDYVRASLLKYMGSEYRNGQRVIMWGAPSSAARDSRVTYEVNTKTNTIRIQGRIPDLGRIIKWKARTCRTLVEGRSRRGFKFDVAPDEGFVILEANPSEIQSETSQP